jgi:hypothetical protein
MSDAMSNYLESIVINHLFRTDTFAKPSAIYVGLIKFYEADKVEAMTGTTVSVAKEASGGAYARIAVTQNDSNWSAASAGGATSNSNAITFPTATADWGNISGVFVADALSGGNLLLHGALTTPRDVQDGDVFKFNAGDLDVTFT